METGSTAAAPRTKRKSPAPRSTDGKPTVAVTRIVTDKNFSVSAEGEGVKVASIDAIDRRNDAGGMTMSRDAASSLLACLKLFLGGRGTGTPRKK